MTLSTPFNIYSNLANFKFFLSFCFGDTAALTSTSKLNSSSTINSSIASWKTTGSYANYRSSDFTGERWYSPSCLISTGYSSILIAWRGRSNFYVLVVWSSISTMRCLSMPARNQSKFCGLSFKGAFLCVGVFFCFFQFFNFDLFNHVQFIPYMIWVLQQIANLSHIKNIHPLQQWRHLPQIDLLFRRLKLLQYFR